MEQHHYLHTSFTSCQCLNTSLTPHALQWLTETPSTECTSGFLPVTSGVLGLDLDSESKWLSVIYLVFRSMFTIKVMEAETGESLPSVFFFHFQ